LQHNIPGSEPKLVSRYTKLKRFIVKKFEWDMPEEEDEDEDDAPVIVEMD
jgi:A1 cistron-splicing factor AAR2